MRQSFLADTNGSETLGPGRIGRPDFYCWTARNFSTKIEFRASKPLGMAFYGEESLAFIGSLGIKNSVKEIPPAQNCG